MFTGQHEEDTQVRNQTGIIFTRRKIDRKKKKDWTDLSGDKNTKIIVTEMEKIKPSVSEEKNSLFYRTTVNNEGIHSLHACPVATQGAPQHLRVGKIRGKKSSERHPD